jgi:GNAT superfamily N-acetyltransferase
MDASFRIAVSGDLEILLPMVREFWVIERLNFVEPEVRRALAGLLDGRELGRVVLIERGGAPIGYLALTLGYSLEHLGRDAFVDELYVRDPHRSGGIGARALERAADLCRELGVRALHLEVDHVNPRARALYERLGFATHERALMTLKVS